MFKNLIQLLDYFKEEKTCYEFLEQQIWNGQPKCPHCGSERVYKTKTRSKLPEKQGIPEYKCANNKCYKLFTAISATVFASSKLPLRTWFGAIFLFTTSKKGISSLQLARQLDVTQTSAWHLLHRIREMFKENAPEILEGTIEADETYVGGKNKNRHANKQVEGTQGRSAKDKTPVVGLLERNGKVITFVVPDTESETIKPLVIQNVKKGAKLITDAYKSYNGLNDRYKHTKVKHNEGEYKYITVGEFHTNNIEGFWSLLKRGILGIYHNVSPKHLDKYCTEFGYRYNTRKIEDMERFGAVVGRVNRKQLTLKSLTTN